MEVFKCFGKYIMFLMLGVGYIGKIWKDFIEFLSDDFFWGKNFGVGINEYFLEIKWYLFKVKVER